MLRIGLTGGIASGKSTVAKLFAAIGIPVIDTDEIAREVVAPGSSLLTRITERFGRGVLNREGSLDRSALRAMVFAEPKARADLDALMHPAILERMRARSAASGGPYQILAIPLLVEKAARAEVDRVLVVDCDEEAQVRRVQARDGATLAEARAILAAQAPRATRLAAADDVIVNDADLHRLRDQVQDLHARYVALSRQAES
jgi:dephospho-CoA kinase